MSVKDIDNCDADLMIFKMHMVPELIKDWQKSSARGAAQRALVMCLSHAPDMDLEKVTSGVPRKTNLKEVFQAVSGYDNRIAKGVDHESWFDVVDLPGDDTPASSSSSGSGENSSGSSSSGSESEEISSPYGETDAGSSAQDKADPSAS